MSRLQNKSEINVLLQSKLKSPKPIFPETDHVPIIVSLLVTFGNLLYEPFLNSVDCANRLDIINVPLYIFLGFLRDHISTKWCFNLIIEELFLTLLNLKAQCMFPVGGMHSNLMLLLMDLHETDLVFEIAL